MIMGFEMKDTRLLFESENAVKRDRARGRLDRDQRGEAKRDNIFSAPSLYFLSFLFLSFSGSSG